MKRAYKEPVKSFLYFAMNERRYNYTYSLLQAPAEKTKTTYAIIL